MAVKRSAEEPAMRALIVPELRRRYGGDLLIELDGHDFHERTKEQAVRDRRRDRWAQENRDPLLRFTGSEVTGDPRGVVSEVLIFLGILSVEAAREAGLLPRLGTGGAE